MGIHAKLIQSITDLDGTITLALGKRRQHRVLGKYEFPYVDNNKGKRIYILATGPSLQDDLSQLLSLEVFKNSDKMCVNFFLNNDLIKSIKPCYYCLADSAFFEEHGPNAKRVEALFKRMNDIVGWDMKLFAYIADNDKLKFLKSRIVNSHIHIVPVTGLTYSGRESRRFASWKKGESVPSYVNVTMMAEYVALNSGFSELYLYGVEHTFFNGLGVDDDNRLFIQDTHFYGTEKRYISTSGKKEWQMKDWMLDKYLTFLEHERMQKYAEYLGAKIINCTRNSLIDAYPRLVMIEKQK